MARAPPFPPAGRRTNFGAATGSFADRGRREALAYVRAPDETVTTAESLRAAADVAGTFTVGVEEEYLLVGLDDPHLLDGAASAIEDLAGDDPGFRRELPPCQVEMATPPRASIDDIRRDLRSAREAVARWCDGVARPIAAAVHPLDATFACPDTSRGAHLVDRFGWLARSQVVGSLQVHVAVGAAATTVAVHDELRVHLPHLGALAAAAPFSHGEDRGMASVRPVIASMLPRQGTPPPLGSWEAFADDLRWGVAAGRMDDPTQWWWDLRPHPVHGTLEVRVADAQPTVDRSVAVVELVVALVRWLAARADAGDLPAPAPSWRIDENRWAAAAGGTSATFADVRTGAIRRAAKVLHALVDEVEPWADGGLDGARRLIDDPSHARLRRCGPVGAVDALAADFCR